MGGLIIDTSGTIWLPKDPDSGEYGDREEGLFPSWVQYSSNDAKGEVYCVVLHDAAAVSSGSTLYESTVPLTWALEICIYFKSRRTSPHQHMLTYCSHVRIK